MTKEHLFVRLEMWVEEGEDGQPKAVRYAYKLPNPENEMIVDLYTMFFKSLCGEIAKLDGDGVVGILSSLASESADEEE